LILFKNNGKNKSINFYKGVIDTGNFFRGNIMQKPSDLLESLLNEIEKRIKENINADFLADNLGLSSIHLQRLFKFAFNLPLGAYIRSRKLTASLENLLSTNSKLVDIAMEYGFEYEQSYLRSFKREFGVTPGIIRKTSQIVKIKPPLHLLNENKLGDSVFIGPDFVMMPQFHIIGRKHQVPHSVSINHVNELIKYFWENERKQIKKAVNPNIFIGLIHNINWVEENSEYITSIQVENLENIPHGLIGITFETSMCVRFRYIGQSPYFSDINENFAYTMYNTVKKYTQNEQQKYVMFKIDTKLHDETYCQIEWYTPVSEKR
jgi:AraC family transcriptional regulator